ncbi:hypothetical protein [Parapedobacter indicus]|uniref:hypothetical protein n=1 Tax=Parapedobacter indicus TaxID=1477437 RepID=UPI000B8379E9|nr:hypothetical protein [Parapedobacter indicus]
METTDRQTSSITPEMIDHYRQLLSLRHEKTDWLRGYSGFGDQLRVRTVSHLFIIRFDKGYKSKSAAYLSVVNGVAEWRYADEDCGYVRCPAMLDAEGIRQLDEVFLRYYRQNRLPDALGDNSQHLSERLAWLNDHFFLTDEAVDSKITQDEEMIGELFCWDGVWMFLRYLSYNLGRYERRLKLKWVGNGSIWLAQILYGFLIFRMVLKNASPIHRERLSLLPAINRILTSVTIGFTTWYTGMAFSRLSILIREHGIQFRHLLQNRRSDGISISFIPTQTAHFIS